MTKIKMGLFILAGIALLFVGTVLAGPASYVLRGRAKLPEPTGQYQVGRIRIPIIDESRVEIFTLQASDQREMVLNIFYPANPASNKQPGPYAEARGFQQLDGVPALLVCPVTPNFVYDAPVSEGTFPILLFGAGFAGPVTYYTSLIEEMVSHGYTVPYLLVFDDFAPPPQEDLAEYGTTVEEWWISFAERNYPMSIRNGESSFHVVQLISGKHYSFATDLPLLQPMFPFVITEGMVGTLQNEEALRAVSVLTPTFFDTYLNGRTTTNETLAGGHPTLRPDFDTSDWGIAVDY